MIVLFLLLFLPASTIERGEHFVHCNVHNVCISIAY